MKLQGAYNCVYINTWRVCQTRVHKSLIYIGNLARHSFSLFDRNKTQPQTSKTSEQRLAYQIITSRTMDDYRNSPTIKLCADLFAAHRCPSTIRFKIRLECASVNWSNFLLISKKSCFTLASTSKLYSYDTSVVDGFFLDFLGLHNTVRVT